MGAFCVVVASSFSDLVAADGLDVPRLPGTRVTTSERGRGLDFVASLVVALSFLDRVAAWDLTCLIHHELDDLTPCRVVVSVARVPRMEFA